MGGGCSHCQVIEGGSGWLWRGNWVRITERDYDVEGVSGTRSKGLGQREAKRP